MMAVCVAVADAAIARGNSAGGTMPGTSVCMVGVSKARAVPLTNRMASIDVAGQQAAERAERKRRGGQRLDHLAGADHDAAVVAVGDLADHEAEHHHREELHEPDQAEVEGAAGQLIDLPADRDRLHLIGGVGRGARAPIGDERAVLRAGRVIGRLSSGTDMSLDIEKGAPS